MRISSKSAFLLLFTALCLSACNDNDDQNIASAPLTVSHLAGSLGGPGSEDGPADQAGFCAPGGSVAHAGRLYVADTANHTIRVIELATGQVSTLAGSPCQSGALDGPGAAARFNYPRGLACDGSRLYVADFYNHTVRAIVLSSGQVTTLAGSPGQSGTTDGTGADARFDFPSGLAVADGRLYVADLANHTVRAIELSSGQVTTLAGSPDQSGTADGTGAAARFFLPGGLACDGSNLYVADTDNYCIRKIVIATAAVSTLAGSAGTPGLTDASGAAARFRYPYGLSYSAGRLYVTENSCIRQIEVATAAVTTLAGPLALNAWGSADGVGPAARFAGPESLSVDGSDLYVTDTGNHTIRVIDLATSAVSTLAGHPNAWGATDATGTDARFYHPEGLTTDGNRLYVADSVNHTIRVIDLATNAVTTLAGSPGTAGTDDGIGPAARFHSPEGLALGGNRLYVADTLNHAIRVVDLATQAVTTLAGSPGTSGSTDGVGGAARFNWPQGLALGGGRLYVADTSNQTIRAIDLATGSVTTLAGAAGQGGSTDGSGTAARFWYPIGLALAGGRLYVADQISHTIRAIDLGTAAVTTLAGAAGQDGTDDGVGPAARFFGTQGLTTDGRRLYVADSANHTVRQIDIATAAVTTLAGTPQRPGCQDGWAPAAGFYRPLDLIYDTQRACLYISDSSNNCIRRLGR